MKKFLSTHRSNHLSEQKMLQSITLNVVLYCPNCGIKVTHCHDFVLNSSMTAFNNGQLTAIGHTRPLYEGSANFKCPRCRCLHTIDLAPIEVHVFPKCEGVNSVETY